MGYGRPSHHQGPSVFWPREWSHNIPYTEKHRVWAIPSRQRVRHVRKAKRRPCHSSWGSPASQHKVSALEAELIPGGVTIVETKNGGHFWCHTAFTKPHSTGTCMVISNSPGMFNWVWAGNLEQIEGASHAYWTRVWVWLLKEFDINTSKCSLELRSSVTLQFCMLLSNRKKQLVPATHFDLGWIIFLAYLARSQSSLAYFMAHPGGPRELLAVFLEKSPRYLDTKNFQNGKRQRYIRIYCIQLSESFSQFIQFIHIYGIIRYRHV